MDTKTHILIVEYDSKELLQPGSQGTFLRTRQDKKLF